MKPQSRTGEFWGWFANNAMTISSGTNSKLLEVLDEKLLEIDQRLSWEIGPGRCEPWSFSISPNLDRNMIEIARQIIADAPSIPGWEFYATRQPKQWDFKVELKNEASNTVLIDASSWTFVVLHYPDGLREVLLAGSNLPPLSEDERWQVAAIVLEGILGEEALLEKIDEFELVPDMEKRFVGSQKPIQELKAAIG